MKPVTYGGIEQSTEYDIDYEFYRHARQTIRISYSLESGGWYGIMRLSTTDTSDFKDERILPENVVKKLAALIPTTDLPKKDSPNE